jgi:hypothetical protein
MIEPLFEVVGEFLRQAVGEALPEIGFHSLAEPFRRPLIRRIDRFFYGYLLALSLALVRFFFAA